MVKEPYHSHTYIGNGYLGVSEWVNHVIHTPIRIAMTSLAVKLPCNVPVCVYIVTCIVIDTTDTYV